MAPKTKPADGFAPDSAESKAVEIHNKYAGLVESVNSTPASQIAADIAARILEQESVDDILGMADNSALGAKSILGRSFVILERPTWQKGKDAYTEGSGYFVVLTLGMQDTSEVLTVTTGAENVLAQLYAMQAKGMLPNDVPMKFIARTANSGNDVLWLAKAS